MLSDTINGAMVDHAPRRWRLTRAGIVNVYQYENEVLQFGGGRLLLRGVNGSGKSTAMNMLLPFLLTARQNRIDAAGEQSRILKSWMLDGRDDAQPVGYLWIEFQRQDEFLVCGCGIRANRQSDTVKTWWFVTPKRPGLDIDLVDDGVPLSMDMLRAALDGDDVFPHYRRADYRRQVEQRLFNGASIDQHIKLINVVRHPRVGDRIDIDLARHLIDALPQLSEEALSEAAQPLEDLEEHRRSVAALEQTRDALAGLLVVYRSYCEQDLQVRVKSAQDRLAELHTSEREEQRRRKAANTAVKELQRLDCDIQELHEHIERLQSKIKALEESRAYHGGQQLDPLREFVADLAKQGKYARGRVDAAKTRNSDAAEDIQRAQKRSRGDLRALNHRLASANELSGRLRTDSRPLTPVELAESSLKDIEATRPGDMNEADIRHQLSGATAAVTRRRDDISKVATALRRLEKTESSLKQVEEALDRRANAVKVAHDELAGSHRHLDAARREWMKAVQAWATAVRRHLQAAEIDGPNVAAWASGVAEEKPKPDHEELLAGLSAEVQALIDHRQRIVIRLEAKLAVEEEAQAQAQMLVDRLAKRTEPELPRLDWQASVDHCLADLLDFAPHLNEAERAGLEGALQASGLLTARFIGDGAIELEDGDLIAVTGESVKPSLSECLVVAVPAQLVDGTDKEAVTRLLRSISTDVSSKTRNAVDVVGNFRLGALRGCHVKERAEFIGVTARRDALASARAEAEEQLQQATEIVARHRTELVSPRQSVVEAHSMRDELPETRAIRDALTNVRVATRAHKREADSHKREEKAAVEAERRERDANDTLNRLANTLILPHDAEKLDTVRRDLRELSSGLADCDAHLNALHRSLNHWRDAVGRWKVAHREMVDERKKLSEVSARHEIERTRLLAIEESIGAEYAEVVALRDRRKQDLTQANNMLVAQRKRRDSVVEKRANAKVAAKTASEKREQASRDCEAERSSLQTVLETRGYLSAIRSKDEHLGEREAVNARIIARSPGADGIRELLNAIGELSSMDEAAIEVAPVTAESVRQSLLRRRDTLGAGYDAEWSRPDSARPLIVEVTGPFGRASLTASLRTVTAQHRQNAGLLNRKQADALRELLQGMVARELADKMAEAKHLIELMNHRLGAVTTAHRVGVLLRWRRRGDLDQSTVRMIQLLAKVPELRSDEDERELRQTLSQRLDEARAEQPDAPYRHILAETLDYKQWHDMAVMLNRGRQQTKLGRRTPLSEGEKKLVTYLPLFAAVAASSDALGEQQRAARIGESPGMARIILLDDAFAKVSEDNHAQLFGLLVELDLDLIATSERLWGTHSTVPALAITEVVRDAALGAILLEHYRWDGVTLERVADVE